MMAIRAGRGAIARRSAASSSSLAPARVLLRGCEHRSNADENPRDLVATVKSAQGAHERNLPPGAPVPRWSCSALRACSREVSSARGGVERTEREAISCDRRH